MTGSRHEHADTGRSVRIGLSGWLSLRLCPDAFHRRGRLQRARTAPAWPFSWCRRTRAGHASSLSRGTSRVRRLLRLAPFGARSDGAFAHPRLDPSEASDSSGLEARHLDEIPTNADRRAGLMKVRRAIGHRETLTDPNDYAVAHRTVGFQTTWTIGPPTT